MIEGCVASCLYDWVYAGCEAGPVVEGEEPGMADTPADNGSTHPHILYCITQPVYVLYTAEQCIL